MVKDGFLMKMYPLEQANTLSEPNVISSVYIPFDIPIPIAFLGHVQESPSKTISTLCEATRIHNRIALHNLMIPNEGRGDLYLWCLALCLSNLADIFN